MAVIVDEITVLLPRIYKSQIGLLREPLRGPWSGRGSPDTLAVLFLKTKFLDREFKLPIPLPVLNRYITDAQSVESVLLLRVPTDNFFFREIRRGGIGRIEYIYTRHRLKVNDHG